MAEYTYKDVIIDPEDPRLEGAIGKEVFASLRPDVCKDSANYNYEEGKATLVRVDAHKNDPFVCSNGTAWPCIVIVKEDPKPEYVPFRTIDEFIEAWQFTKEDPDNAVSVIDCYGIWLKHIIDDEEQPIELAVELWDDGLVLGNDVDTTRWEELLERYQFLDGTPCGRKVCED